MKILSKVWKWNEIRERSLFMTRGGGGIGGGGIHFRTGNLGGGIKIGVRMTFFYVRYDPPPRRCTMWCCLSPWLRQSLSYPSLSLCVPCVCVCVCVWTKACENPFVIVIPWPHNQGASTIAVRHITLTFHLRLLRQALKQKQVLSLPLSN